MRPGAKVSPCFHPETREWWIAMDGKIRSDIEGQDSFIARKSSMLQGPLETIYSIEAVGDKPALRFEVNIARAKTLYRVTSNRLKAWRRMGAVGAAPDPAAVRLWCVDSNLNAMFRHDTRTGSWDQRIQLSDRDPLPRGMTISEDTVWYCDDVGVVCRIAFRGSPVERTGMRRTAAKNAI